MPKRIAIDHVIFLLRGKDGDRNVMVTSLQSLPWPMDEHLYTGAWLDFVKDPSPADKNDLRTWFREWLKKELDDPEKVDDVAARCMDAYSECATELSVLLNGDSLEEVWESEIPACLIASAAQCSRLPQVGCGRLHDFIVVSALDAVKSESGSKSNSKPESRPESE